MLLSFIPFTSNLIQVFFLDNEDLEMRRDCFVPSGSYSPSLFARDRKWILILSSELYQQALLLVEAEMRL